ncbi:hypothetical protein CCAL12920_08700 [Campylobacter sp. RM12920]|uniref:Cell surface protein n=1 Tax=Campylobacter californiensis TaxID=1032243 RepID=A0ABD4JJZ3_9BACT|nr:hypothetical protein [Campylobacter sp. RM12919]MBE2988956.1 hypothetical protein [Campylobacter sp. RM12920]
MIEKLKSNLKIYKDSDGLLTSMKSLAFEYCKDIKEVKSGELKDALQTKMSEVLLSLQEENLASAKNLKNAMEGLNQALVGDKEDELFALYDKRDEILNAIKLKQEEIRNTLKLSFETAEEVVAKNDFEGKEEILNLLNNAIIRETRMLGILKESAQSAFLTTIERAEDVNDTILQIAKNMTYVAILGGEFSKNRMLEISKTIIVAACEVANEGHIFSKELVDGSVNGAKEGILKAIEKLKDENKFAPDELKLNSELAQLDKIDEDFIAMLRHIDDISDGSAKNEIYNILNTELDTNFARLKRMSEQASEEIRNRIEEIKSNPNITSLVNAANEKFNDIKNEFNERSKKFKSEFDSGEKIADFEKKANEKFEELKQMDIKAEAKKFGDRAYKAAKDFLSNIKKDKE